MCICLYTHTYIYIYTYIYTPYRLIDLLIAFQQKKKKKKNVWWLSQQFNTGLLMQEFKGLFTRLGKCMQYGSTSHLCDCLQFYYSYSQKISDSEYFMPEECYFKNGKTNKILPY